MIKIHILNGQVHLYVGPNMEFQNFVTQFERGSGLLFTISRWPGLGPPKNKVKKSSIFEIGVQSLMSGDTVNRSLRLTIHQSFLMDFYQR